MQPPQSTVGGAGVVSSQSPAFTLPIRYMILGILGFGIFAVDLALQSVHLGSGSALVPSDVALTHVLTLGSLLAFVMGAVYQLSTVAFLIPVEGVRLARLNFWLYTVSAIGLISSMAEWNTPGLVLFGTLMNLSVYIYAVIVIVSVAKTKIRGAMQGFVLSAHAYLILAVTAALLLILGEKWPGLSSYMLELLLTHILLAVGGFFTFLIMGFSFKLLPMFTLSHGFTVARQKWTLTLCHLALWVLIASVWLHSSTLLVIGSVVGIAAFVIQLFDLRGIVLKRMRKKMEIPIRAVLAAAVVGLVTLLLGITVALTRAGIAGWQGVVTLYLMGWVALTVMGYAYKIVPFLVWSKRYSKPAEGSKRLLISDLINLHQSLHVFIGFVLGLVLLTFGSVGQTAPLALIGGVLIAASILVFCVQILRVINPAEVRKEFGSDK